MATIVDIPSSITTEPKKAPEHLNSSGLRIKYVEGKGRGVYACHEIPAQTVVEISPVLLFTAKEYEEHGKYTVLDHYTFVWRDGRMALALGLGSLFNHSQKPNVSYTIDPTTESIRYTTSRKVMPDEELCIFYGHKLWFEPVDADDRTGDDAGTVSEPEDGWGGLLARNLEDEAEIEGPCQYLIDSYADGDSEEVIAEEDLPFKRLKLTPEDEEEDDMDAVRKEDAWVVDIPDPRLAATMLKWLKQSGFDTPSMAHLKRIRKIEGKMSMVLTFCREHPPPPTFPEHVELPTPYVVTVPKNAALTQTSLKLKSTLWPTIYAPRKKFEPEPWSRGKVRWACAAMAEVVKQAREAGSKGELPIAAYVPVPYDEETKSETRMAEPISAHDTRKSSSHPLRHSIINLVRAVGELRASTSTVASPAPMSPEPEHTPVVDVSALENPPSDPLPQETAVLDVEARNGAHYLLTSLTLFTTHEPCIMCSMALLHSRVNEVFYLLPMKKTGGCGSVTCVPRLQGVNHRYAVNVWKFEEEDDAEEGARRCGLTIDEASDA